MDDKQIHEITADEHPSQQDHDLAMTASIVDELGHLCDRVRRQISAVGDRHNLPVHDLLERVPRLEDRGPSTATSPPASASQARFFAMVSHELRNALTAVYGWSELLVRTQPDNRIAHEVMNTAGYTIDILDDLIDIGHIERGKLRIKPVRVEARTIADEAMSMVQPEAARMGVVVSGHNSDTVSCYTDPSRVRQILVNLLRNAIRHSGEDSVALWLSSTANTVEFTVEDHGNGIAPERQASVFSFAGASTDPNRGAGMGLMLSRLLAEYLGGALGLESAAGAGTRFTLRLPRTSVGDRTSGSIPEARAQRPARRRQFSSG